VTRARAKRRPELETPISRRVLTLIKKGVGFRRRTPAGIENPHPRFDA
jgi:hypothetical protein